MKSLTRALGVAVLALAAGAVLAQTPAATAPTSRMDKLATLLDLTDGQKSQVQTILQEQHAQMRQLHSQMKAQWQAARAAGGNPDFAQMRTQFQQLHQETLTKLSGVLSPSQLTKFRTLESMMRHRGFGPRGFGGGAPPAGNSVN